jgi:MFS transporter, Spinster family, sphingosine-1-phosphate transporter
MKRASYAWWVVILLWVVACLNYLDRQVIFAVFPLLRAEMAIDDLQLGLLSTVFLWVYGVASPFGGYLADRVGRKRVLVLSLLAWTTVTLLTGFAANFGQLLAARALLGLSQACYLPAALALISELHGPNSRSLATGVHQSGLYAGMAVAGVMGGWMGGTLGWRSPFLVLGAAGLLYVLVLHPILRKEHEDDPRPPSGLEPRRSPFGAVLQVSGLPGYKGMLIAFAGFSATNWIVYTWLPLFIFEKFQLSLASAGFSATFYLQVTSFAGILGGGYLADRWSRSSPRGRLLTQVLGIGVAAPFLFLVGFTASLQVMVAALLVFGAGKGFYDANTMPVLAQIARPDLRATGFGVFNLAGCMVGGTMAAAAGALKPAIGLAGAIQASAVVLLVSAVALLLAGRHLQAKGESS